MKKCRKISPSALHAPIDRLSPTVRESETFRGAEALNRLIKIPTGDGMALVFATAPRNRRAARSKLQGLGAHPEVLVRMGIHSGPVSEVSDVTERTNVAGAGINIAPRVMDCGDAARILLSQHVADDLMEPAKQETDPFFRAYGLALAYFAHGDRAEAVAQ